ncbi:putative acyl-CoA hydrolase [Helianthus anomalus]
MEYICILLKVLADDEIEIESKALRVGKVVAVASVEFRNKKTGKVIAQGRHTKYFAVSSKL